MQVDRKELMAALNRVKAGLADKEVLEQATMFIFDGERVSAFDNDIWASHPSPLQGTGELAVAGKELLALLGKLKEDELDISVTENELLIKAGRKQAGIAVQKEITLPVGSIDVPEEWYKIPEGFCKALGQAAMNAGANLSQPALTYVQIKDNKVTSTDGLKLLQLALPKKIKGEILLPASTARVIAGSGVTKYAHYGKGAAMDKRWAHYKTEDDTVYSCRTGRADFPDVGGIVASEGEPVKLPPELSEALGRAAVFADNVVNVELDSKGLQIKARSANGWFREKVAARYRGEPLRFSTRPELFIELLRHSGDVEVTTGTLKLTGDGFVYLHAMQPGGKKKGKDVEPF